MTASGSESASVLFSATHEHTSSLVRFSPDGRLIASATMYRLVVRDVDSLQILHIFSCLDRIDQVEWSGDSKYLLCGVYARGVAQVWSLEHPDWHCKIDEGPLGLAHVRWAPDGRHILATSDFRLRITIWSLLDRAVFFLRFPKYAKHALSFSAGGEYMALGHRRDGHDYVQVVDCSKWAVVHRFNVASKDLADLRYAPRGDTLCIMDGLLEPQVLVYRQNGQLISTYKMQPSPGCDLGPKGISWSPSGDLLIICGFDHRVNVVHRSSWAHVAELEHNSVLSAAFAPDAVAYVQVARSATGRVVAEASAHESESDTIDGPEMLLRRGQELIYTAQKLPLSIPTVKPTPDKLNPHMGIGIVEWSADGRFFATRNDGMPRAIFIWDGSTLALHSVMLQVAAVRSMAWHPTRQVLAVCTGIAAIVLWSPQGCQTAPLPDDRAFRVSTATWNSMGDALVLLDKDSFCVSFVRLGQNTDTAPPIAPRLTAEEEEEIRQMLDSELTLDKSSCKQTSQPRQRDENVNTQNDQS